MIPITNLKLFPIGTKEIAIPNRPPKFAHTIFFYPENTNLLEAYPKLNIKRMYLRRLLLVGSRFPKFIPTQKYSQLFREIGLFPIRKFDEKTDNIIVDASFYLDMLEARFGPGRYRRTIVNKPIKSFLEANLATQSTRQTILMYVVDLDKQFPSSIYDRRIWPILDDMMKLGDVPFNYFLFCFLRQSEPRYTLFKRPDKSLQFMRIRNILMNLKSEAAGFEEQEKSDQAADEVVSKVEVKPEKPDITTRPETVSPPKEDLDLDNEILNVSGSQEPDPFEKGALDEKTAIKGAVSNFLKAVPRLRNKFFTSQKKELKPEAYYQLATASILYNVSGDLSKSINLTKDVPDDKKKYMFDRVKSELLKDIVPVEKARNNSRQEIISKVNLDKISEDKNPQHLLSKRKFDFSTTFERDLIRCFELLSTKKDYPLTLKDMKKTELPVDAGDLDPSIYDQYDIILVDERRRNHPIQIQVPRLLDDGTFVINGKKKYISYQIVLDPIFFIKLGQAKLETLYAPISIHQKKTKKKEYFDILIGGYKLPLMTLLVHYLGFDNTCRLFNIRYQITPDPVSTAKNSLQLEKGFINFFYDTKHAENLISSLYEIPMTFNEKTILTKEAFTSAIIKTTGNRNCIFKIDEVLTNIMEPVCVQVLKTKLLPFTLSQIILYICQQLVTGRVDDRNDITKQRIRSSEVFIHQIEKLVLGSYNEYRTRRVSGDNDAEYRLDVTQAVKQVVNSVVVKDLENINPTEELSCMTRVIPIGEGGIPDGRAITLKSRGVHPTYYGNIDSMDTPEGGNVGVINQLAIGAKITNSRGSFLEQADKDEKAGVLGVNSAMVPFIGSTDGCRVMFSGSQGRQSIPISGAEPPIIQTGYESLMTNMLSDNYIKKAVDDGYVLKITVNAIAIKLKNGRIQRIGIAPVRLQSGQGQDSINYFKPIVREGETVKKDQIVAEGKHIIDGMISQGTNLLAAIMVWKGYSYEDGYIISDKLAKDKLKSSAYHEIEILVGKNDNIISIAPEGKETKRGESLLVRTSKEVENIVGLDEDELVQGQIITKSPGGRIISLEIYPNGNIKGYPALKESFEKFRAKYEEMKGDFPKKFVAKVFGEKEQFAGVLIRFGIEEMQICELGDKLTNNYGGKGTIAKIEKEENMPITPWGERVQIIVNPLAIINRMNPSTIKELQLSLVSKSLAKQIVKFGIKKNLKAINLVNEVLTVLDRTKDKMLSKQMVSAFKSLSDRAYADYIQKIENSNYYFPIIVPPFQEPTNNDIVKAMKIVGVKPAYTLVLPEYGVKTAVPISIGYLYYKKLEQQSGIKMSARSTGMVDPRTKQATAGKKAGGGQKIGELDSWSIINHGAINVLREFFGPLSDDHVTKNQIISDIIQTGTAEYRTPRSSPTREIFYVYLKSMMLEPDIKNER